MSADSRFKSLGANGNEGNGNWTEMQKNPFSSNIKNYQQAHEANKIEPSANKEGALNVNNNAGKNINIANYGSNYNSNAYSTNPFSPQNSNYYYNIFQMKIHKEIPIKKTLNINKALLSWKK